PPPPRGHAADKTALTVSPALSVSPPPGCLSVGPFGDVDDAARAAALLRGKGFDPRQRRQAGDGSPERRLPGTLYWLDLVPPAGRPGSAAKAVAIRPGGHSQRSDEAAPQALGSPESAAPGDLLQREIRLLVLLSCGSEADLPDVVAGREAHPVGEVAGEAALA